MRRNLAKIVRFSENFEDTKESLENFLEIYIKFHRNRNFQFLEKLGNIFTELKKKFFKF